MQNPEATHITIRRAVPADAEAIIRLINQADAESAFMTREPGEFDVSLEAEQALLAKQGSERAWFVAVDGGTVIGLVNLDRVHTRTRLRHRAVIGLVILRAYWSQGIGRRLMEQVIAWAKEQDIEQIELGVVAANVRAHGLYVRLGFVETGRLPHVFKYRDGTYADEIKMLLQLVRN